MKQQIIDFLNTYDYDVQKSGNARWIDQKCTPDVLSIIADCILEFTQYDESVEFSIKDIWTSLYAKQNVESIFQKPSTTEIKARHEYDKFFSQPINLFAYSKLLEPSKNGNRMTFKINNKELLEKIAIRDLNALSFLVLYIEKVLKDSGIYKLFTNFLDLQSKQSFYDLKNGFTEFTIKHTKINTPVECGRIFTKILNPLAFNHKKKGTRKGHTSNTTITLDELKYNRLNWRDELSGKDKTITRQEYSNIAPINPKAVYDIQRAKKVVRRYNEKFNDGLSEIMRSSEMGIKATQIHHIFPQAEYEIISDYIENLIAITPNQHYSMAHPNNQTTYIDKDFQYICLLAKTNTIKNDTAQIYSFESFKIVLSIGLHTDEFSSIDNLDFAALLSKIDFYYSDFNMEKYGELANLNREQYE